MLAVGRPLHHLLELNALAARVGRRHVDLVRRMAPVSTELRARRRLLAMDSEQLADHYRTLARAAGGTKCSRATPPTLTIAPKSAASA